MFINTEFINETLDEIDDAYQSFLRENNLESSPSAHYAIYSMALKQIQTEPLEDTPTQKALEIRIRLRMQQIAAASNLTITKVIVP